MAGGDAASSGGAPLLVEDLAALLVLEHLALHALERVVDRLRVAAEILGHLLVRVALEIEAQRVRLERREAGAEAEDEALELLGGDDADGRVVDARARERVAERAPAVVRPAGVWLKETYVLSGACL